MTIAVIDGQGAGIGQSIIKKIKKDSVLNKIELIALGTNEIATTNMKKAGADLAFTGEDSICAFLKETCIDGIIGPIGVLCSGGINGEITEKIARAVFILPCNKYIIPLRKHGIFIPGSLNIEIKQAIEEIIDEIKKCPSVN